MSIKYVLLGVVMCVKLCVYKMFMCKCVHAWLSIRVCVFIRCVLVWLCVRMHVCVPVL